MKTIKLVLVAAMIGLTVLLAACSKKAENKEPVTLTIAGVLPNFQLEYGEQLIVDGQQINLNIVPYHDIPRDSEGSVQYDKLYGQFSPDIVALGGRQLQNLIEDNLLMPLDSFAKDSGQLDSIVPIVQNKIREVGEGQLYAWPEEYSSQALFYNKELLDRYHVPYPPETPSWDDVLALAMQLSSAIGNESEKEKPLYPFLSPGERKPEEKLFAQIYYAGLSEEFQLVNPQTMAVTANTDGWKRLWESFIEAYQHGVFSNEAFERDDTIPAEAGVTFDAIYKLFIDGQAGFVVASPDLLDILREDNTDWWGMAQQPGSRQAYLQLSSMYGINPNSAYTKEAWKLIEYITSDENIQRKARIGGQNIGRYSGNLPVRTSIYEQAVSLDLSPFYEQEPAAIGVFDPTTLPTEVYTAMSEQMIAGIGAVLRGDQTAEQALTQLQGELEASVRAAAP